MLRGKKYPQNVRALQLLTEELIRPVLEKEYSDIITMDDLENALDELSALSRTTNLGKDTGRVALLKQQKGLKQWQRWCSVWMQP